MDETELVRVLGPIAAKALVDRIPQNMLQRFSKRLSKKSPLQVDAAVDSLALYTGEELVGSKYWIPKLDQEAPPPISEDWVAWARRQRFVPAGALVVHMLVSAKKGAGHVGIGRPRLINYTVSIPGTGFLIEPGGFGGGGMITQRHVRVGLDSETVNYVPDGLDTSERPSPQALFYVDDKPFEFEILALAEKGVHMWTLEFDAFWDGRWQDRFSLSDGGQPFMTMGTAGLQKAEYDSRGHRWQAVS